SENTFSCAFSRTEQVLSSTTSASSGVSVLMKPSAAFSTSTILSESYSFIWQPKVLIKTFFCMVSGGEHAHGRKGPECRRERDREDRRRKFGGDHGNSGN